MAKHHNGCACCSEGREAFQGRLEKIIHEVGHAVITAGSEIAEGTIAMAYTMGLSDQGLPELLLFGIGESLQWRFSTRPRTCFGVANCR